MSNLTTEERAELLKAYANGGKLDDSPCAHDLRCKGLGICQTIQGRDTFELDTPGELLAQEFRRADDLSQRVEKLEKMLSADVTAAQSIGRAWKERTDKLEERLYLMTLIASVGIDHVDKTYIERSHTEGSS